MSLSNKEMTSDVPNVSIRKSDKKFGYKSIEIGRTDHETDSGLTTIICLDIFSKKEGLISHKRDGLMNLYENVEMIIKMRRNGKQMEKSYKNEKNIYLIHHTV